MSQNTRPAVSRGLVDWLARVGCYWLATIIMMGMFSNWRYFPSPSLLAVTDNYGKALFLALLTGVFLVLPSMAFAATMKRFEKFRLLRTETIFVALYIAISFLEYYWPPSKSWSFGVSEGELIANGEITPLGWVFREMLLLRYLLTLLVYLVAAGIFFQFRTWVSKLKSS